MSNVEIVLPGQSVRLPSESECVSIVCPDCGSSWQTSERHSRRIAAGEFPSNCRSCKRPRLQVREVHRRYWLLLFGCDLQPGMTAAEYLEPRRVSAGGEGLPPELAEIVEELDGFLTGMVGVAA